MKRFFLTLCLMTLLSNFADAAVVPGKIYYKIPTGDIVERIVDIEVPSRGQGEVVLSGTKFRWSTKNFKSVSENGRTVFTASFKTNFMNFQSTIVFIGTYLKGNDKVLYYGDFYKAKGHVNYSDNLKGFNYEGAFSFEYNR